MKKKIYIIILVLIVFCLVWLGLGLGLSKDDVEKLEKNVSKIELSGDLVTLETYYHNVAEVPKDAGTGIAHWFEKDRKLWIEYTGIVKVGINMSNVKIDTNGNQITVFIPKAEIIGEPDVLNEEFSRESFIDSEDGLINKNKITIEDATEAMDVAQNTMQESVKNDSQLLKTAQKRAKNLIEEYINQFSGMSDTLYSIKWEYEENNLTT